MPRIKPSETGGSATAERTLALLGAFRAGDVELTLAELATRTGLYKSTALRLLRSLETARFVSRSSEGRYRLGGEILRLEGVMSAAGGLKDLVMPALRNLVAETRETAALHVKRGSYRVRLYWVDSSQPLREHVVLGERLPLDRGAGGLALQAFSGAKGADFDKIRRQGYALSIGGRLAELSGISCPVFDAKATLVGALTLTMPTERWSLLLLPAVLTAAEQLTVALGGAAKRAVVRRAKKEL
jgi:DNA-binding IclR family transcriptional regulator